MRVFRRLALFGSLALLAALPMAVCAQQNGYSNPYPDDNWVPQGVPQLGAHTSFHTEFTFSPEMLRLAAGLTGDNEDQRIVARLRSISVHLFSYPAPGMYDPALLDSVRAQYDARGWDHFVSAQPHPMADDPTRTDLWVRFAHADVEGMVVLVSNATHVDLIEVNGTLSPLDLLHLRGHFGIPAFPAEKFVPAPGSASPPPAVNPPVSQ